MKAQYYVVSMLIFTLLFSCKKALLTKNPALDNPPVSKHFLTIESTYDLSYAKTTVAFQVTPEDEDGFPIEVENDTYYKVNNQLVPTPTISWARHYFDIYGVPGLLETKYHAKNGEDYNFAFSVPTTTSLTLPPSSIDLTIGDTIYFDAPSLIAGEEVYITIRQTSPPDPVFVSFTSTAGTNYVVLPWQELVNMPFIDGAAELRVTRRRTSYHDLNGLAGIKLVNSTIDRAPVILNW